MNRKTIWGELATVLLFAPAYADDEEDEGAVLVHSTPTLQHISGMEAEEQSNFRVDGKHQKNLRVNYFFATVIGDLVY